MRIRWRLVLWIAVIVVPVVVAGVLIWSKTRDLSRYQSRLEDQVRRVTGRQLTARVPLKVHFSREPALIAEGVTLSNAPWGSRPELARVRKITMYLEPFSLLLGESKISRLVLEGADILVERNEAGDANLEMLPPPDGSGPRAVENKSLRVVANPAFPWIGNIEVRDSILTVAEGGGRPPVVLEISSGPHRVNQIVSGIHTLKRAVEQFRIENVTLNQFRGTDHPGAEIFRLTCQTSQANTTPLKQR